MDAGLPRAAGDGRRSHLHAALVRDGRPRVGAGALCLTLSASTLSRPHYTSPDVSVGEPAFVRTLEAHTDALLVQGNRAQILLNGDEIFPAMLAAIREAKMTITFANFIYEKGDIARDMAQALAQRCRTRPHRRASLRHDR